MDVYYCVLSVAKLRKMNDLWRTQLRDRVLTYIQEWASYGHLEYFESSSKLKTFTAQKLKDKEVFKWYKDAIHRVIYRNRSQILLLTVYTEMLMQASKRTVQERVGWT